MRLEKAFLHRYLLPPGPFSLRFFGLGVAELALRGYLPRPGAEEALDLTPEEVEEQREK